MSAPAVSVLLPVRDAAPFLLEALDSLGTQTHADFEVLLEDDGSEDGSLEIARGFARADARFDVVASSRRGIVSALNAAAARARGDLLVRMDADDVSAPERLERLVEAAREHPDTGFFASRVRYFPREGLSEGMRRYETWINAVLDHDAIVRERFVECPLPHPAWALRREVFESLGGYREGPFPEDYDLFLRAVEAGARFHKVEDVLLAWREGRHRLSRSDARFSLDAFFELKATHLVPFLEGLARPIAVAGAGPAGRRWARRLADAGLPVKAFLDGHPSRVGSVILGARVLGWDSLPPLPDAFVVCAGRREETRRLLQDAGLAEGGDFLCVQ